MAHEAILHGHQAAGLFLRGWAREKLTERRCNRIDGARYLAYHGLLNRGFQRALSAWFWKEDLDLNG